MDLEDLMKKTNNTAAKMMNEIIRRLMEKEDRKDAEFRFAILTTEIGDLGKYITHDPKLNPNARPHGSNEDEKLAYGQAIAQIMGLAYVRGISYNEALAIGLSNWMDADWRRREALPKQGAEKDDGVVRIYGKLGCSGFAEGNAYVVGPKRPMLGVKKSSDKPILVMEYAKPEVAEVIKDIAGLVTDQGGYTCHAASIAREFNVPCVVGTGNATQLIRNNDYVYVMTSDLTNNEGMVMIKHK